MPIYWKPDVPIGTYIAYKQKHPKSNHARLRRIFNNASIDPAKLTEHEPEREPHHVEGTLEMQKLLLQGLARKENTAKGLGCKWLGRTESGQRGTRAECEVTNVDRAKE
jgi:hypothetical protein